MSDVALGGSMWASPGGQNLAGMLVGAGELGSLACIDQGGGC